MLTTTQHQRCISKVNIYIKIFIVQIDTIYQVMCVSIWLSIFCNIYAKKKGIFILLTRLKLVRKTIVRHHR